MWMDAFGKARPGLSRRKQCWDSSAFGATTHTHTLVLSYYTWFTVEGPTPSSAWCCHLRAERERCVLLQPPCHHRASQSVAALSFWAWEPVSFWGAFCIWLCFKQSALYRAEKAQSRQCIVGNPFTEITIVNGGLGVGVKCKCVESMSLSLCLCVWKITQTHRLKRKAKERD